MGFFRKELLYILVLVCGSCFVGQSLAYYSPAGPAMCAEFGWSETTGTWFSTLSSLVAIIGSPLTNVIVPKLGRKIPAFIYAVIAVICWILIFVAQKDFSWLAFVGRGIHGLCVGGLSSICSMYIVELSPDENKGSYGTLHQFGVTFGMAYDYLIGIWCPWKLTTILSALFALLLSILIWFIPESPVAFKVQQSNTKVSLFQKKYIKPAIAALLFMFFQQFSGINALGTNLESIFRESNIDLNPALSALLVGLSQCISTAAVSYVVGRFGRRIPFVISSFGQCAALLLTWATDVFKLDPIVNLVAIFIDFFFFGVGYGPIPWFICPELFDDGVRQLAVSISTCINWLFVSIIIFIWPPMRNAMGMGWGIFIFAIVCLLGGVWGIKWMPDGGVIEDEDQAAAMAQDGEIVEDAPHLTHHSEADNIPEL